MDDLKLKEILVRKPFWTVLPKTPTMQVGVRNKMNRLEETPDALFVPMSQSDFLRQYYPSGHLIFDTNKYPDVYKQDPETNKWYVQEITRCAFAFQQLIAAKQTIHITGNDVQFELSEETKNDDTDDTKNKLLSEFRKGWHDKNMESAFFDAVHSIKVTGDTAVVFFFDSKGKLGRKVLSFLDDERIYPHFDSLTGELMVFARTFYDYNEEGKETVEWAEVWDDTYKYLLRRDLVNNPITRIKEFFGMTGFTLVEKVKHRFNRVPVAYYRDKNGACWLASQDTIEKYEEAFSYFFENNKAYAFPVMVLKGDGVDLKGEDGAVKVITIEDNDGSAEYMQHNDVSTSYNTLLNTLYERIYELSFAIKPPELKSGDLPGVALKLLYSPAIEKAIVDANSMQPFLEDIVELFKYGYGLEMNNQTDMIALSINTWIEPYVHQNDSELITNLSTAVQNAFLSKRTASERIPKYAKNDEIARVIREQKEKMELEVQKSGLIEEKNTDEEIYKQQQLNKMNGSDINTGHGGGAGRPNRSGQSWDDSGNYPGRNGWQPGEEYKRA